MGWGSGGYRVGCSEVENEVYTFIWYSTLGYVKLLKCKSTRKYWSSAVKTAENLKTSIIKNSRGGYVWWNWKMNTLFPLRLLYAKVHSDPHYYTLMQFRHWNLPWRWRRCKYLFLTTWWSFIQSEIHRMSYNKAIMQQSTQLAWEDTTALETRAWYEEDIWSCDTSDD